MLNEDLYERLVKHKKRLGPVRVVKENQKMVCQHTRVEQTWGVNRNGSEHRMNVLTSGEEFKVNCPFCTDTRQRLTINHRWAVRDKRTGFLNLWLVQCFNEHCEDKSDNRYRLYRMLYKEDEAGDEDAFNQSEAESGPTEATTQKSPGPIWPLDNLARTIPQHEALKYLWDRLLDPVYLAQQFGLGFVLESPFVKARNRLYAPITLCGELVGWQCRYLGDPPAGVPKWYTCPGMDRRFVLYNYDEGSKYATKVLVEGPADVWGFGKQAMGLLGKDITDEQVDLLAKVTQEDDTVVVMLDPDWTPNERKAHQHHITKAVDKLEKGGNLHGRVLPVFLPPGTDPGTMDRMYMRRLILKLARERNLPVSFKEREEACLV